MRTNEPIRRLAVPAARKIDQRWVALTHYHIGNPAFQHKAYKVAVEDGAHNVIGWDWPAYRATEDEARALANDAWTRLRKSAAERVTTT